MDREVATTRYKGFYEFDVENRENKKAIFTYGIIISNAKLSDTAMHISSMMDRVGGLQCYHSNAQVNEIKEVKFCNSE